MKIILSILFLQIFCSSVEKNNDSNLKPTKIEKSKSIVFVHGMYMTPKSWDSWSKYFKEKGFKVYSPSYPLHDLDAEVLRKKHPDKELAKLTFAKVKAHYKEFIEKLDEKPILIGHSMGGLVVQSLLNDNIGAGAIALSSAPPKGIVSEATALKHGFSFVSSSWPVINPFASDDTPIFLEEDKFIKKFANGIDEEEARLAYKEFVVPESRRLPRSILKEDGKLDFSKPRRPLLLIAAEEDRIIPNTLVRDNKEAYTQSSGITKFLEFKGRGHLLHKQKGWEEIADACLKWIEENR
jgi:pimeloyl-ACP methyl ester carboxylesterase